MNYQRHYIVLDAAKMQQHLDVAKEFNSKHSCLYKGEAELKFGSVAPWLFTYPKMSYFDDWFISSSGGQNWGVIIEARVKFEKIYFHLKKFLRVQSETGTIMHFRFYDPRVLPTFLETCDEEQLIEFFGPVDKFILEKDYLMIEYQLVDNKLVKKQNTFLDREFI